MIKDSLIMETPLKGRKMKIKWRLNNKLKL